MYYWRGETAYYVNNEIYADNNLPIFKRIKIKEEHFFHEVDEGLYLPFLGPVRHKNKPDATDQKDIKQTKKKFPVKFWSSKAEGFGENHTYITGKASGLF